MNFTKNAKYRTKVILSYLVIVVIPVIFGLAFLYNSIVLFNEDSIQQTLNQQMDQYAQAVKGHIDDIDHASYLLSTNTTLCQFVADNISSPVYLIHRLTNDVMPMCSWFEASTRDFYDFAFFSDNKGIPETEIFHSIEKYAEEDWFRSMESQLKNTSSYWEKAHPYHAVQYRSPALTVFTLYRKLLMPDSGRTGYFAINVSAQQLFSSIVSQPLLNEGTIIAVSGDGTVLVGNLPFSDNMHTFPVEEVLSSESDMLYEHDGEKYMLINREISPIDVHLIAIIPQNTLNYMSSHSRLIFFLIAFSAVSLIILMAIWLSDGLISRINIMVDAIRQMQTGNYNVHIDVSGNDEIDELAQNINVTSERINMLINTVHRGEILQKETEIRALQAQINPHFLFNVLETFKMMAEINDDEKLSDGITSLGQMMQYSVYQTSKPTTLEAELQHLRSYINIQNLLLNNRLTVHFEIGEDCLGVMLPRLILQPLVENSIKHGIAMQDKELIVFVKAALKEDLLQISVTDNGSGMSKAGMNELCKKVYAHNNDEASHGIGLWNVNQRLQLIYGNSRLQFSSDEQHGGFSVMISIPLTVQGGTPVHEKATDSSC